MANAFGSNSDITVNSQVITPYVKTADFNRSRAVLDVTTKSGGTGFGAGVTKRGGLTDGTFVITGLWDDTVTVGSETVLSAAFLAGTNITSIFSPDGTKTYTFSGVVSQYDESSPVDDMVAFTCTIDISGAVTEG